MTDAWRADRGRRGRGFTILTPANRYASRLPNVRDGLVFKLATPRLAPGVGFGAQAVGAVGAELLWVKRPYEPWPGLDAPERDLGHRDDEPWEDTGVPGFRRRELLDPVDARHDFNMSLLAFEPGRGLGTIEIHDEEHGLYLTAGGGTYHLDGQDFAVRQDDFIYMGPYCPQSFRAGEEGAQYLLYKDVYRDGF